MQPVILVGSADGEEMEVEVERGCTQSFGQECYVYTNDLLGVGLKIRCNRLCSGDNRDNWTTPSEPTSPLWMWLPDK